MMPSKLTVKDLEEQGLIGYRFYRGSTLHNLRTKDSDYDEGGVFFAPQSMLYGLRNNYQEQVSDEKGDVTFYEFGRWMELIAKGNPQSLESLFAPEKYVIGKIHPVIQMVLNHKDEFLSKENVEHLVGYSKSQILKCRGLNKKINFTDTKRKDVLDFCYTFKDQGSQPIKEFLKEHNLSQKYCGLVSIPNMKDIYGVYYDFAAYFKFENITPNKQWDYDVYIEQLYGITGWDKIQDRIEIKYFLKYGGIVDPDDITKSNEVRLSSIPKGEKPICFMTYNKDAYTYHCKMYREYKEWEKHRNPARYESNKEKTYDAKNMCECMRLIHTGREIAEGKGFNVERTWDRDYLLDIKAHKFSYEEIISAMEKEKEIMENALKYSALPDKVDENLVNKLLIEGRNQYYNQRQKHQWFSEISE